MGAGVAALQEVQEQTRDWGATRRSPYGLPIPRIAVPVTKLGSATGLVFGTQVLLVEYKVRANWFFLACGIVLGFMGGGNAPNPGDVQYTIDIDTALGSTSGAGYVEKDYGNVPFPLGSFPALVWPVEFKHRNGETVRIKGTPIANMGTGAGNFLTAALLGWEWPEEGWEG